MNTTYAPATIAPAVPAAGTVRVTPNLFGISSGIAGLAGVWNVAHGLGLVPAWPAAALFLVAAAVWLVTVVAWVAQFRSGRRSVADELRDPVFGPFVSLLPIVGMLLGVALSEHAPTVGTIVFDVFAVATLLVGVRLAAGWLAGGLPLAAVHPGYLVPTVAGGMLAAGGLARTGQFGAARAAFAIGILCWLVIGSILLARLLRRPPLPAALVPTLAIGVTPPVLAGNAYLAITGGRVDALGYVLAAYAVLMVVVQVRLVARYRRLAFTHGIWAFAFSYAATAVFALHWIELARPLGGDLLAALVLVAITVLIGAIGVRTVVGLCRGTFLPRTLLS